MRIEAGPHLQHIMQDQQSDADGCSCAKEPPDQSFGDAAQQAVGGLLPSSCISARSFAGSITAFVRLLQPYIYINIGDRARGCLFSCVTVLSMYTCAVDAPHTQAAACWPIPC